MDTKYKFSLKKVSKYCLNGYGLANYECETSDIIQNEIYSPIYHPEYKDLVEKLIKEFPVLKPHIEDLFFIMEHHLIPAHEYDVVYHHAIYLYDEIKRIYFLRNLLEVEEKKSKLSQVDLIIYLRENAPLDSDFVLSDMHLNEKIIKIVLKEYLENFNANFSKYLSSLYYIDNVENIPLKELRGIRDHLYSTKLLKYNTFKTDIEKEIAEILYDFLIDNTDLNPKDVKVSKQLAIVIYSLLCIFKVFTKSEEPPNIAEYIRDILKNPKRKIRVPKS